MFPWFTRKHTCQSNSTKSISSGDQGNITIRNELEKYKSRKVSVVLLLDPVHSYNWMADWIWKRRWGHLYVFNPCCKTSHPAFQFFSITGTPSYHFTEIKESKCLLMQVTLLTVPVFGWLFYPDVACQGQFYFYKYHKSVLVVLIFV